MLALNFDFFEQKKAGEFLRAFFRLSRQLCLFYGCLFRLFIYRRLSRHPTRFIFSQNFLEIRNVVAVGFFDFGFVAQIFFDQKVEKLLSNHCHFELNPYLNLEVDLRQYRLFFPKPCEQLIYLNELVPY